MTDPSRMTDEELETEYRKEGSSAMGAALQILLFKQCQKLGHEPKRGEHIILGKE